MRSTNASEAKLSSFYENDKIFSSITFRKLSVKLTPESGVKPLTSYTLHTQQLNDSLANISNSILPLPYMLEIIKMKVLGRPGMFQTRPLHKRHSSTRCDQGPGADV
jgi:hypothetical protein